MHQSLDTHILYTLINQKEYARELDQLINGQESQRRLLEGRREEYLQLLAEQLDELQTVQIELGGVQHSGGTLQLQQLLQQYQEDLLMALLHPYFAV